MPDIDFTIIKRILVVLAHQIDDFYLAGGTALSLFYFQHRESYDLDFFTKDFQKERIVQTVEYLEKNLSAKIALTETRNDKNFAKFAIYQAQLPTGEICKIDFVQDVFAVSQPLREVDGIKILSIEDIYLRKIFTLTGHILSQDMVGADLMVGGRQEAKDLYDVYCLSTVTNPLSQFANTYGDETIKEGLVRWFRTYDRIAMKTGLLDLRLAKDVDYRLIEEHFKFEIDRLLEEMIT